ncbi:MAG TPA: hypothetical protein VIL72_01405, partial [Beijerinckiaceae bacterium]
PSAGLYLGPIAWFVSLQAKYALTPWVCAHKLQAIHPVTVVALLVALAGVALSARAARRRDEPQPQHDGGRPHAFTAWLGVLISSLFAAVILVQGAAAFFLDGCER